MTEAVIAGLVVLAIAAIGVWVRHKLGETWSRRNPVGVRATRLVGDEWNVGFSGDLPEAVARVGRGFCVHYSNPNCVLRQERDPEDERTTDLTPRRR